MRTDFPITVRLGAEIRTADTAGLKPGDHLSGLVVAVGPAGRARIDFGAFRATADLPLGVQTGDRLQVSVARTGNPLYLRLESPDVPAPVSAPVQEPLIFPDSEARQAIGRAVMGGSPSLPGSERLATLLAHLSSRMMPLALTAGPDHVASRLADQVENSGLLLEKRLETVLRHLLTGPRPPDLQTLSRHPWIRNLLAGDTKSLALQTGALITADPAGTSPEIKALGQPLARLLADLAVQQNDAVHRHNTAPAERAAGALTYGAAARTETPTAARIGRWTTDLVTRMRLSAGGLPPGSQEALAKMAAAADQIEMLVSAGYINPAPIRRILAHARALLTTPGSASAAGQDAMAIIGQLSLALEDLEGRGTGRRRVAALGARLVRKLDLCPSQDLHDAAARLKPLLMILSGSEAGAKTLAVRHLATAIVELKACLQADGTPVLREVWTDLDRLENRLERYLSDPAGGGSDHGETGRDNSQVLAFTLPLAEARNPARLKVHFQDRRRRGQTGEHHISLMLTFAHLGSVRADLHLKSPDLAIRFAVTEERTRARLQAAGPDLAAALRPHFGHLEVTAVVSPESVARFTLREPAAEAGHAVDLTV